MRLDKPRRTQDQNVVKINLVHLYSLVGLVVVLAYLFNFLSDKPQIPRLDVTVRDTNYYFLPYVRVEFEHLERGIRSEVQNYGSFIVGPFYEGEYRVVVKLGEESDTMSHTVYDKIHNFTEDMTTLDIRINNVIQQIDIQVSGPEVEIPVSHYGDRTITISPHKESGP